MNMVISVVTNMTVGGSHDLASYPGRESRPVVMLVVDAAIADATVEETLRQCGYCVIVVAPEANPVEAFCRYRPQCLVFDVLLPGSKALGACRTLKRDPRSWSVPALVVSTQMNPATLETAKAAGAQEFMSKPFAPIVLLDTMRRLVGLPSSP
jgi:CheY-like chemotaxis protein